MQADTRRFPTFEALASGLAAVLYGDNVTDRFVEIIERQPNPNMSSLASEIVSCRLDDGSEPRLFCKYDSGERGRGTHSNRGGVAYEAEVYRHLLESMKGWSPRFYGSFEDKVSGQACLVLEYLDMQTRASATPETMQCAAGAIGRFHAASDTRLTTNSLSYLKRYDASHYAEWASWVSSLTATHHYELPWLKRLCERFPDLSDRLLEHPVVIHSEFYPGNLAQVNDQVVIVDWESATIAAGEIDVATLVLGWNEEMSRLCQREYLEARWPKRVPDDFDTRLKIAQIYNLFRWLGEGSIRWDSKPRWDPKPSEIEWLRPLGERLNLV